jgi:hypothetical protein
MIPIHISYEPVPGNFAAKDILLNKKVPLEVGVVPTTIICHNTQTEKVGLCVRNKII